MAAAVCVVAALLLLADARYPWLGQYLAHRLAPPEAQAVEGPTHILFALVDHFEPDDLQTVERWVTEYPAMANRHRDADGHPPQHTWFWYFGYSDDNELDEQVARLFLQRLARLPYDGFGEIELHLHHWFDSEATWRRKVGDMLRLSREVGAMTTAEPRPRTTFGFIHGMWSLDNARGGRFCGVNNELALLRQVGCYADFTHPSWGSAHPRRLNEHYYATDDPRQPKSYADGVPLRAGRPASGDLMIVQGPGIVHWRGLRPTYDHGDVTVEDPPTPQRIDGWIRHGIRVAGRPEWLFVKVHTHGAVERDAPVLLGEGADRMYDYLETRYNDGQQYILHYVTAREMYNIAKAAEAGLSGDPNAYRDDSIPPYVNRSVAASVPYEVLAFEPEQWRVRFAAAPGIRVEARLRGRVASVDGGDDVMVTPGNGETVIEWTQRGDGVVTFRREG